MLQKSCIGQLVEDAPIEVPKNTALHPTDWRPFRVLTSVPDGAESCVRLTFALPQSGSSPPTLGLSPGQHLKVRATVEGRACERAFTPISLPSDPSAFELAVKAYPQGRVSRHLAQLHPGDTVEIRGPSGSFVYRRAECTYGQRRWNVRWMALIGGGSGVTPLVQIAKAALADEQDPTQLSLLSCNTTERSIMVRKELEDMVAAHPKRMALRFAVTSSDEDHWTGMNTPLDLSQDNSRGSLRDILPPTADGVAAGGCVLVCGPPGFCRAATDAMATLGFPHDMVIEL
mmetsp:Transcript_24874/g.58753  ORF Transcript_24874/g.58753 Transcript_24874/m.58753 type:complete len:287 (+) Transcript_24874:3-863(+)